MVLVNLLGLPTVEAATPTIDHVHPLNWWAGMVNPTLQILLHGEGIGAFDVELKDAQGIALKDMVKFDNKNYIIIYIDTKGAPAQQFSILLKKGQKTVKSVPSELKQRGSQDFRCQRCGVSLDARPLCHRHDPKAEEPDVQGHEGGHVGQNGRYGASWR